MRAPGDRVHPLLPARQGPADRQVPPRPAGARGRPHPGGRFEDLLSESNLALVEALTEFAETRGHTLLELAISWFLSRPQVASVIAGATSPEQAATNARAGWRLTLAECAKIDAIVPR